MTLLLILPGLPATGVLKKTSDISKYLHLSDELREKLVARLQDSQTSEAVLDGMHDSADRTELSLSAQCNLLYSHILLDKVL